MSLITTTATTSPQVVSGPPSEEGDPALFNATSQSRHTELGKTFATRKIEVATLAIRATATQNAMFSVAKAARSRRQRREGRSSVEADRLLDATRSVLGSPKQSQKSVTFSNGPPLVHEIETITPESTSHIAEEATNDADETSLTEEAEAEDTTVPCSTEQSELEPIECSASPSSHVSETSSMTDESPVSATSYSSKMASERKGQRISRNNLLSKLEERKQNQQDMPRDASEPLCSSPSVSLPNSEFIESQIAGMLKRAEEAKTSAFSQDAYDDQLHERNGTTLEVISEIGSSLPFDASSLSPSQSASARKVQEWRDSLDSEDSDATTLTTSSLDEGVEVVTVKPTNKTGLGPSEGRMSDFSRTLLHEFARITGDASIRYRQLNTPKLILASSDFISDHENQNIQKLSATSSSATGAEPIQKTERAWKVVESLKEQAPPIPNESMQGVSGTEGTSGRLYIKVVAAENLDFPIDKDSPGIKCVLNDGNNEYSSGVERMEHTVQFDQEFQIDHVDLDHEFTLTLHATESDNNAVGHLRRLLGKQARPRSNRLSRYTNLADGAIAQTRVAFRSIESQCRTTLCTASFALINGWYRNQRSSILLGMPKKERLSVQEKAVGKITVQLFYLSNIDSDNINLPANISACEQVQHIVRFHRTCWQRGYMSQLGGDVKFWRRRFFRLQGGRLFSYSDTLHAPRTIIDLTKVKGLASDRLRIVVDSTSQSRQKASENRLLSDLDEICRQNDKEDQQSIPSQASDDDELSFSVKNGFHLVFDNGEKIEFFCDTADERERWLDILRAMIGRIPVWPSWLGELAEEA